jgi:hypothetical protein
MASSPFWWVADPDTRADLRYDLVRELKALEELENPSEGRQPWQPLPFWQGKNRRLLPSRHTGAMFMLPLPLQPQRPVVPGARL